MLLRFPFQSAKPTENMIPDSWLTWFESIYPQFNTLPKVYYKIKLFHTHTNKQENSCIMEKGSNDNSIGDNVNYSNNNNHFNVNTIPGAHSGSSSSSTTTTVSKFRIEKYYSTKHHKLSGAGKRLTFFNPWLDSSGFSFSKVIKFLRRRDEVGFSKKNKF